MTTTVYHAAPTDTSYQFKPAKRYDFVVITDRDGVPDGWIASYVWPDDGYFTWEVTYVKSGVYKVSYWFPADFEFPTPYAPEWR